MYLPRMPDMIDPQWLHHDGSLHVQPRKDLGFPVKACVPPQISLLESQRHDLAEGNSRRLDRTQLI